MDVVCGQQKAEEDELESGEGGVGCLEDGGRWAWGEDVFPELDDEG